MNHKKVQTNNAPANGQRQVRCRQPNRLVIHKSTGTFSYRVNGQRWVCHVQQIPFAVWKEIPAKFRRLLYLHESYTGVAVIEGWPSRCQSQLTKIIAEPAERLVITPAALLAKEIMSTHAQITIEGSEVLFYIHSNGYPEAVLVVLTEFTEEFFAERGHDPEYFMAELLWTFFREYKPLGFTGYGLSTKTYSDIDYLYVVSATGEITTHSGRDIYAVRPNKWN
jgi:hypothetical protein